MKIVVQGWLGFPHSICMVNMKHIKYWLQDGHSVYVHNLDPLHSFWLEKNDVMTGDQYYKDIYSSVLAPNMSVTYDLLVSISVPLHRPLYKARKKLLFVVAEYDKLTNAYIKVHKDKSAIRKIVSMYDEIITPSKWSSEALANSRIQENVKCRVIPHGIDVEGLYDRLTCRRKLCSSLKINESSKILLTIGPYIYNKGIDQLLQVILNQDRRDLTLITKSVDSIYVKSSLYIKLLKSIAQMGITIRYIGQNLTEMDMLVLIAGADAYCSLFRAEGFNLPISQAIGVGTPIYTTLAPPVSEYIGMEDRQFAVAASKKTDMVNGEMLSYYAVDEKDAINKFAELCKYLDSGGKRDTRHNNMLLTWRQVSQLYLSGL